MVIETGIYLRENPGSKCIDTIHKFISPNQRNADIAVAEQEIGLYAKRTYPEKEVSIVLISEVGNTLAYAVFEKNSA